MYYNTYIIVFVKLFFDQYNIESNTKSLHEMDFKHSTMNLYHPTRIKDDSGYHSNNSYIVYVLSALGSPGQGLQNTTSNPSLVAAQ